MNILKYIFRGNRLQDLEIGPLKERWRAAPGFLGGGDLVNIEIQVEEIGRRFPSEAGKAEGLWEGPSREANLGVWMWSWGRMGQGRNPGITAQRWSFQWSEQMRWPQKDFRARGEYGQGRNHREWQRLWGKIVCLSVFKTLAFNIPNNALHCLKDPELVLCYIVLFQKLFTFSAKVKPSKSRRIVILSP